MYSEMKKKRTSLKKFFFIIINAEVFIIKYIVPNKHLQDSNL